MTLRPFFPYFGSKWRSSPKLYPKPKHSTIIEPFAGAAGYSVRYNAEHVILSDKDTRIVGVWNYLIRVKESEVLSLPDLEKGQTVDDLNIPQEAKWLIGFWLNPGVTSPRKSPSTWMLSRPNSGSYWGAKVRQRIASQLSGIRHWKVLHTGFNALPNVRATWFVDPPYVDQGKQYRHGNSDIDYEYLSAWCKTREGQVIVCEGSGADWLDFKEVGQIATANGARVGKRFTEVLWLSDDTNIFNPSSG